MYQRSVGGFNNMTSKEVQEMIINFEEQIERFGEMITLTNQLSILKSYKQDLERLEALEKENKKWREIVGCDLCEALGREILLEENEKLKKAIEILKMYNLTVSYIPEITRPHLSLNDYGDGVTLDINEYELLKEVINNE